jgi:hypothetical protein
LPPASDGLLSTACRESLYEAEPDRVAATRSATAISAKVMRLSRAGVSQVKSLAASHARRPVAPPAAAAAVAMH